MNAPTLVLIPGLMCDQALWEAQLAALRARGARCRVAEPGMADSLLDMARALLAAHPGALAVLGHSMGGRVALEVARLAGERLHGLALLDTGYRALPDGASGERERAGRLALLEQARAEGIGAMARLWLQGMVPPQRLADRALVEAIVRMFERRSLAQFEAQIQALLTRPDASAVLARITCPTLLLCGEQDRASPPAQHREMAQLIPGSVLELVPDCGHMAPLEQPLAVSQALLEWLQRVRALSASAAALAPGL